MCGILGAVPSVEKTKFQSVLNVLTHRGPDGEGIWHEGENVILGHRRLAILDVTEHGTQPMQYRNRFNIVFNGEIYNFLELKRELQALGHHFSSESDTEVLLAAYCQWGENCVSRLNGMWAFGIWDNEAKSLFLSRDRMGEKPLYYTYDNNRFVFASEQKALLPFLNEVSPSKNFNSLIHNSYAYEVTEECIFKGIKRFPAAHFGWLKDGNLNLREYWSVLERPIFVPNNYDEQVECLRELLLDSTKMRMRADVPIGTGLSGGVDSSAVAACIAQVAKKGAERLPPNWQNSFVASFPGTVMDEAPQAKMVADFLGINHNSVIVDAQPYASQLERLVYLFEDVHEVNPIPHVCLYSAMRGQGVLVTLDGHGGDELFCGYESSPLHALAETKFNPSETINILSTYRDLHPKNKFFRGMSFPRIIGYLLKSKLRMHRDHGGELNRQINERFNPLNAHLYNLSFRSVLPTLLRNYDRYAMINGVEIRMPLLDHRVVEFAFSLPWQSKVRNGYTKSILRDAVAPWLPESIVRRKDKIGFAPPIHDWIRGPLKEYFLDECHSRNFKESSLIEPNKVAHDINDILFENKPMTLYQAEQTWKKFSIYLWEKVFLQDKVWKVA